MQWDQTFLAHVLTGVSETQTTHNTHIKQHQHQGKGMSMIFIQWYHTVTESMQYLHAITLEFTPNSHISQNHAPFTSSETSLLKVTLKSGINHVNQYKRCL